MPARRSVHSLMMTSQPSASFALLLFFDTFASNLFMMLPKASDLSPRGELAHPKPFSRTSFTRHSAFWQTTRSRVAISSEWTEEGSERIDSHLISPGWGFELLRDEDQIEDHCARFQKHGIYHPWIQADSLREWIILDCHHSIPRTTCKEPSSVPQSVINHLANNHLQVPTSPTCGGSFSRKRIHVFWF